MNELGLNQGEQVRVSVNGTIIDGVVTGSTNQANAMPTASASASMGQTTMGTLGQADSGTMS